MRASILAIVAILLGQLTCAQPARAESHPKGPIVMRLVLPATPVQMGDSLILHLEFTNVSAREVRIWMAPLDRLPTWNLKLLLTRLWVTRVFVPSIRASLGYAPRDSDVVIVRPGRSVSRRLGLVTLRDLRGGGHWIDSEFDCQSRDGRMNKLDCLGPGAYAIAARLDLSTVVEDWRNGAFWGPGGKTDARTLFHGLLETAPARLVITARKK